MPVPKRILTCNSPYDQGGMGQHFAHLIEKFRQEGALGHYYTTGIQSDDPEGTKVTVPGASLLPYTPVRWWPAWRNHMNNELFDARVAKQLKLQGATYVMGFAGKALRTFRRSHALGAQRLELVVPNSHVSNVYTLHQRAHEETGIHDSWLNKAQVQKTLREYELADYIYVHSNYVAETLIARGVPESKLRFERLPIDARFKPPAERLTDGRFSVVYVGRVDATKGIPLLIEAFRRLNVPGASLRIMGGWSTRAMRQYMERVLTGDDRIYVEPGDPLPVLQKADVFVHPSYEDGFGYAPAEALACGVPVIVTEDTGMKEYVVEGRNGYVVPTGSVEALVKRLQTIYENPLSATTSLVPVRYEA